ncbi:G2-specific protein kinase NimA, putative [Talaromyces stipitatus ATCC 10500]|uniref:non-specific serine/threonine protein kinase n=1 Tax=Talaromyces stipitatus (strain ATCC 10500 / CBS 375.48 / QM 6759 / NRRL 1006) TaxID=441959 RepID=B8MKY0_TALSN|nr:G2-specific protein kinase NimA, putative [Talaromyces stipitatus ATCC 10500]EED15396.1 G2-specific protein kinase NimA, putative [Talaromyces stipitatus ATCC 10500]
MASIALSEADKYEVLEKIGAGSFGIIRKVRRKSDGFILCRKEINYIKMSQKEREQLTAEFNILSSLRHPNIVAYYHREHLKASQDLYLYMEYCGGGDLGMVIKNLKNSNKYAEEEFVWRVLAQLATALYRCHYGTDAPPVGSNLLGPPQPRQGLKGKQAQVMILHRDLKPENIFLGSDNSVKLGDFGLSKLMESHDFASTYVGTPFYMSPEICAAEKYTLHSDIWSLGCIMYELCQKAPPFNAKTHMQLVQRIREGKFPPLPDIYSDELQAVIASCLRVNPDQRPDTAAILNLPVVRLVRKEREALDLTNRVKRREEAALQKMKELEIKMANFEKDMALTREEIDATVRREWEVKARLEIERQVQMRYEELSKQFETEVRARVAAEMERVNKMKVQAQEFIQPREPSTSSVSCSEDSDFPSTTDISDLSLESPRSSRNKSLQKVSRTPFNRAKTTVESPMDIQMGEPSPITIASLSLSPRRTAPISKNLFTEPAQQKSKWEPSLVTSDDEDDIPELPSPTRPKVKPDPFKTARRPMLRHQTTAMVSKMGNQPSIFPAGASRLPPPPTMASPLSSQQTQETSRPTSTELRSKSPTRRLSKIPSTSNLIGDATSPTRKGAAGKAATFHATKANPSGNSGSSSDDNSMYKAVMQRNMGGRTLVELAQARAGGRAFVDDLKRVSSDSRAYTTGSSSGSTVSSFGKSTECPATWDPNSEQMPSPFVSRRVFHSFR